MADNSQANARVELIVKVVDAERTTGRLAVTTPPNAYANDRWSASGALATSRRQSIWLMLGSYAIVVVFLLVVALLIWLRFRMKESMNESPSQDLGWILLLACILVLPLLATRLPAIIDYAAAKFSSLKLGAFEFGFRGAASNLETQSADVHDLADSLPLAQNLTAEQYMNVMEIDGASKVVNEVIDIERSRCEVVIVDLGIWVLPNLYFFALLLDRATYVRQLIFTSAEGSKKGVFVGMCSPQELVDRSNEQYPIYAEAALSIFDPSNSNWPAQPLKFFTTLKARMSPTDPAIPNPQGSNPPLRVTPDVLRNQLKISLNSRDTIEAPEMLTSADFRRVFLSSQRFFPVTSDGQLRFVLDQWRASRAYAQVATLASVR